jgi:hypothetical protein
MRKFLPALAAAAVVVLGVSSSADAASSKGCKALAPKNAKVALKGKDALVLKRGSAADFTLTYWGCLYSKPRLYKLANQNGGDTEFFGGFVTSGRYLAYVHTNAEQAAVVVPGWVELVDLKRRKLLFSFDAVPGADSSTATQILLQPTGAIAWIGALNGNEAVSYSVQTALPGAAKPAEVDSGPHVGPKSLRRVPNDDAAFSWVNDGKRQTAAFGGPTVTPQS